MNNKIEQLIKIVNEIKPDAKITAKTALLADRILDSLEFMNYITIIEEKFNVTISDKDIEEKKLGIIENMAKYLE